MNVFLIGVENEFDPRCKDDDMYKKMYVLSSMTAVLDDYSTKSLDAYTQIYVWLNVDLKNNKLLKMLGCINTFSDELALEKLNDLKDKVIVYARSHGVYEGKLTAFCVLMHRYMYWVKLRNEYIEEYLSKINSEKHKMEIRNIIYKYQNTIFNTIILSYIPRHRNEIELDDSLLS